MVFVAMIPPNNLIRDDVFGGGQPNLFCPPLSPGGQPGDMKRGDTDGDKRMTRQASTC